MGTSIIDSTQNQRATNYLNGLHDYFKGYEPLSFFKIKYSRDSTTVPILGLSQDNFVKLSGSHFMNCTTKKVYNLKSDRLVPKMDCSNKFILYDKLRLYDIVPLTAIINLSKEGV